MKKILFILIFNFILTFNTKGQTPNFVWAKAMGGTSIEIGYTNTTDALENVYTIGNFQGTCDFDPGVGVFNLTSAGITDIFISKLDAAGNFVWAKAMGGAGSEAGYAIILDAAGNIYTTGNFGVTCDFDPGIGVFNLTSAGNRDIFVSKLDAAGNFVWAKAMGGISSDGAISIVVDALGNAYTTGSFAGTADFDPSVGVFNLTSPGDNDIFVSKLDAVGNFVWAKAMGGTISDNGYSITTDALGNIYTTGDFGGTADFDPGVGVFNLTSAGLNDAFVSKLDALGNFVWAKAMGGAGADNENSIAVDASGNVYTTGTFNLTADFDPGVGVFNLISAGLRDVFVSKLDVAGNFVWAKAIANSSGDDGASFMILDAFSNIYTVGGFQATADFDPSASVFNVTSAGLDDGFISKLDASGNFVWAKTMGGTGSDYTNSVAVDASGNILLTGSFFSVADFDPSGSVFNLTSAGSADIFVNKLCQTPESLNTISGSTNVCAGSVNTYSIAPTLFANSYNWTLPIGWLGSSTANSINLTIGSSVNTITVTAVNTCGSSTTQTLSITANATNITGNVTTGASIPVAGFVTLYRYEPMFTKFDSVSTINIGGTGAYTFTNAINSNTYIIKVTPTSNNLVITYGNSSSAWMSASQFVHGCANTSTANVNVISLTPIIPGVGSLSGVIEKGPGYGQRSSDSRPLGTPIKGIIVKGGRNPNGNIVAQTTTDANGTYTLSGLPTSGDNYFILVDIPGLDTNNTYHKILTLSNTSFDNLNFIVDSAKINPVNNVGINELTLTENNINVFPNPALTNMSVNFTLLKTSSVKIELFDILGKQVKTLVDSKMIVANSYNTTATITDLDAGIYFVKIGINNKEQTVKICIQK